MRAVVGVLYWSPIGFLALNALYVSVDENRVWSDLLVPVALALFGAWCSRAYVIRGRLWSLSGRTRRCSSRAVLLQVFSTDWSCSIQPQRGDGHQDGRRLHDRLHRPDHVRARPLGDDAPGCGPSHRQPRHVNDRAVPAETR